MLRFFSQKAELFLIFGLFAFATLSVFGLGHTAGMPKNDNGDMTGCIFTGQVMLCKMSIIEHVSLWQSMFTAMPQKSLMLIALLILFLAVIFVTKNILAPSSLSSNQISAQKLYVAQHPDLPLFDPLKESFSQGILNPKIYSAAN